MRIIFTAKTAKAENLYRKYLDEPAREIETIEVINHKPLTISIVPKMNYITRKALDSLLKKEGTRKQLLADWGNKYARAMEIEGLRQNDYTIEVAQ